MVRNLNELIESITSALGESATSDVGISLIEDVTDTINSGDAERVKTLEEDNQRLRNAYIERFKGIKKDDVNEPDYINEPDDLDESEDIDDFWESEE